MANDGPIYTEHRAGEIAYLDCNYGMMRCKVLSVPERSEGRELSGVKLIVQCLEKTWDLPAGTVIEHLGYRIIPKGHRITRNGQYRINTLFAWLPGDATSEKDKALIAEHKEKANKALQDERKRIYKW